MFHTPDILFTRAFAMDTGHCTALYSYLSKALSYQLNYSQVVTDSITAAIINLKMENN
jgi:hypothetical protein